MAKSIQLFDDTSSALKKVCDLLPEWAEVRLGNLIVLEGCRAMLSENAHSLPTVEYVRRRLGFSDGYSQPLQILTDEIRNLREMIEHQSHGNLRVAEEPEIPPPRKRGAR